MNKIIISGGPGSGKSTLLAALESAGFECVSEVSRELIRQQVANGSECVPWGNLACFAKLCLHKMVIDFQNITSHDLTFFDRGIPDIIAYLRFGGLPVEDAFWAAAKKHRYAANVFIAPPWEAIYINDNERWQTFGEAVALCTEIKSVYAELGYQVTELSLASVEKRVDFTLTKLQRVEYK